jgi:hypothetical protein
VFLTISGLNKEGKMPMRRFLLAIIALSALCVNAGKSAESTTPQFYAGVSIGHDRMTAKRTEELLAGTGQRLFFSNNKTQRTNGVTGKVIAGFLWTVPNTQFVLSPEMYIGHGSGQITLQGHKSIQDLGGIIEKDYQSTFKQSLAMGLLLRAGFYLSGDNNFLYALTGIDCSKFENKFMLASSFVNLIPVPTLFEKRSKFLKSTFFGMGIERKINKFKVGIDCRYMPYSAWGNYSRVAVESNDKITVRFKPKIISTTLTFCYIF